MSMTLFLFTTPPRDEDWSLANVAFVDIGRLGYHTYRIGGLSCTSDDVSTSIDTVLSLFILHEDETLQTTPDSAGHTDESRANEGSRTISPRRPSRPRLQLNPLPPPSQTRSATAHNPSSPLYFMPSRPIEAHPTNDYKHRNARSTHPNPRQHGHHRHPINTASARDVLLSIPAESLTHITSFLQPPDLFALGQTCKPLHAHVTDDNTWRRAFVYQYFGISPEADLRDDIGNKTLMLRRADQSWKKEFVLRYNLRRYVIATGEVNGEIVGRRTRAGCGAGHMKAETSRFFVASPLQRVRLSVRDLLSPR